MSASPSPKKGGCLPLALKIGGLFIGLCLIGLVVGYLIEDGRGRKAWDAYLAEQREKGVTQLLWHDFIPPEVPDEENMAKAPGFDLDAWQELSDTQWPHRRQGVKRQPGWRAAQPWDLALLITEEAAATEEEAARVLLDHFATHEELLASISAAAARPACRMDLNYEAIVNMTFPIGELRDATRAFAIRGAAALRVGDTTTAANDLLTIMRLVNHFETVPTIIVHLVQLATVDLSLQLLWEGQRQHAWNDNQLTLFENAFAQWDAQTSFLNHLRSDRAGILTMLESMAQGQQQAPNGLPRVRLIPKGWIYQNMVQLARLYDDYCLFPDGEEVRSVSPQHAEALITELGRRRNRFFGYPHPYDFMSVIAVPFVDRAAHNVLRMDASLTLAQHAIALERHFLVNERYPDHYAVDPPLIYRLKADRTPLLYHLGTNDADDGGTPYESASKGDWVWQWTYPEFDPTAFAE